MHFNKIKKEKKKKMHGRNWEKTSHFPFIYPQNPSTSCSGNTSPSPFSPLPHTFSTESISPDIVW